MNTNEWLSTVKMFSKNFVSENYPEELSLFDSFWLVFYEKLIDIQAGEQLNLTPSRMVINQISFVSETSLDLVSPVVLSVFAEVMVIVKSKNLTINELEKEIAAIAARHRAKPSLIACLTRSISLLYQELKKIDDTSEAKIYEVLTHYRIWTAAREEIVESVDKYEKNKSKYLFWIDLDKKQQVSALNPKLKLPAKPVELLHTMVKHIGSPIPLEVLSKEFSQSGEIEGSDIDNIEQNLSKLHKFCGNNFRQYLFTNHKRGFGLKDSFRDKYFLFERISGKA